MDEPWQPALERLVDAAVEQHPLRPDLVAAAVEAARGCDVRDEDDVAFAFAELFRLAGHAREVADASAAEEILAAAAELALEAYAATASSVLVRGLARQWHRSGLTDLALTLLGQALRLDVSAAAGGGLPAAELGNLRGDLLRQAGESDWAEVVLTEALAAVDEAADPPGALRSSVLNNLGLVHQQKGDLAQARARLIGSLDAADVPADPVGAAITLDNLGLIETELARRAGPLWLTDEYVNAVVEEHLNQAEDYFDRAGELFEAELPRSAEDYVVSLLNRTEAAEHRGDDEQLDTLSEQALELAAQPDISAATRWTAATIRGRVLLGRGRPAEATALMAPWFAQLWDVLPPHEQLAQGLVTLVRAAATSGDQALADDVAAQLVDLDSLLLAQRLATGSEAEARHRFGEYQRRTDLILGHCLPQGAEGVAPDWLYELVLNRKGLLAERQGSAWLRARRTEGARAGLLQAVRELRAEVAHLDLDGAGSGSIREARHRHEQAERRLGQAEAQLHREAGPDRPQLPHVTVGDLRDRLGPGTVLLDVTTALGPDDEHRHVVFQVRGDGPIRFRDLGPAGTVTHRVRTLTSTLGTRPPGGTDPRGVDATGIALVGQGEVLDEHVVIAPTGSWGQVPFGALPGPRGTPLIDDHLVTLVPSARRLVTGSASPAATATSGPPLVIGDPDFDLEFADQVSFFLSMRFPRLAHAAAEAHDVAERLGCSPLTGRDATRRHLLDVEGPRILHLASHGVFLDAIGSLAERREPRGVVKRLIAGAVVTDDDHDGLFGPPAPHDRPDDARTIHDRRVEWLREIGPAAQQSRSILLLAGVNAWLAGADTPAEIGTGIVSANEFALLDLGGTELVVLSACRTGVGAVDYADGGHLGLRAAAIAAGAARCISTLWNVDDATTTALMSTFYRELAAGHPPENALRTAQLTIRDQHPDPYFWAGWITETSTAESPAGIGGGDQPRRERRR